VDVSNRFITTYTGVAISSPEKRYEKLQPKDLRAQNLDRDITGGWAAIVQHYFLAALVPKNDEIYRYYTKFLQNGRYIVGLYGPTQSVAPGAAATQSIRFYAGPKNQELLESIAPNLELSADYGSLWFIAKPLFWLLNNLYKLVGNWGVAIMLLTLIVKLAFFKLSAFSYKSMANLRKLQPKMADLKERYGEDKAKMSQMTMELYRKEKVNPLGGCLPIMVQIPVFISLYWVLLETVELRNAGFAGWIKDLSSPDPYFILPVLMGISMFIQNRLNPPPQDPIQAKVLASFPIVFSIFFAYFPAGLVLYWVCNNTLSIAQQWVITRKIMGEPAPARR
jgi:YidC/Oxa1 family membrane protein insertase